VTGAGFWHMGGYALYVWSAYGVTAGLLGLEVVQLLRRRRAVLRRVKAMNRMGIDEA
jgi:heme exporter protein D